MIKCLWGYGSTLTKVWHEIRDPVHVFIRLDSNEREVLNSRPVQRLRHIHQLALSYLVYPGATHKRFEHSLGVMELAGKVYDVVTSPQALTDQVRDSLPAIQDDDERAYWRRVVRMAALCHDIGHLPFSHAAESELLPEGWSHEQITKELILSEEMRSIWNSITPPLRPEDVAKIAVGPRKARELTFSTWEAILAEIIVGDAFGVDRMDYLLRDSLHAGVAYGRFDHHRLIDTLRILPVPPSDDTESVGGEPTLGVEEGGIQAAEALLLARYLMYSQVYVHPVRRIYDIHLKDFLKDWLKDGVFHPDIGSHLCMTDNEVTAAMLSAAYDPQSPGHDPARRIICREHFRVLYERHPQDVQQNPEAGKAVFESAKRQFGSDAVRHDDYRQPGGEPNFPVLMRDGRIVSSMSISETLHSLPLVAVDYVFVKPELREEAEQWLRGNREEIIQVRGEEE